MAEEGYLVPGHSSTQLGEEIPRHQAPMIRNAQGKGAAPVHHGNLIVVTSSLAGEGKTFFAMNLALSIAMELDASALLVEADILKSRCPRMGLPPDAAAWLEHARPTLSIDASEGKKVMLRTNMPEAEPAAAGSRSMQSTELGWPAPAWGAGSSTNWPRATRDRIIVFDAPPLLQDRASFSAGRPRRPGGGWWGSRAASSAAAFAQAMDTLESRRPVVMTGRSSKSKEVERPIRSTATTRRLDVRLGSPGVAGGRGDTAGPRQWSSTPPWARGASARGTGAAPALAARPGVFAGPGPRGWRIRPGDAPAGGRTCLAAAVTFPSGTDPAQGRRADRRGAYHRARWSAGAGRVAGNAGGWPGRRPSRARRPWRARCTSKARSPRG